MVLEEIVRTTRASLGERKLKEPLAEIKSLSDSLPPARDFAGALAGNGIHLIAEIKRASPSRGPLHPDLDPAGLAAVYADSGAAAISVLTETFHFRGSFDDLAAVRSAVDLPLLCKDFIVDPYQVYYARVHGADAVLLIAAVLNAVEIKSLQETAQALRMSALVEVHNEAELENALSASPRIIGINNRDLRDFTVNLNTTLRLRPLVPESIILVSESGIGKREDIVLLQEAGIDSVLIGEALVTSPDPGARIRYLLGKSSEMD